MATENNENLSAEEVIELEIEATENNENLSAEEVSALESMLIDERERAIREETSIRNSIDSEVLRAIEAETELSENVAALQTSDEEIKKMINDEVARATESEELLRVDLSLETQRATASENQLRNDFNTFKTATEQNLAALTESDEELETDISDLKKSDILINEKIDELEVEISSQSNRIDNIEGTTHENIQEIQRNIQEIQEVQETFTERYAEKSEIINKIDKKDGYSLVSDEEIARLSTLKNYDDSAIKADITHLENTKQEKGDYAYKKDIPEVPTKLSAFENDTNFIKKDVDDLTNYKKTSELDAALSNKVDKKEGYSLIADSELERLSTLKNFDGTSLKNDIQHLEDTKQEKGNYATKEELPTALSELSNDVGFIKKDVDNLTNYSKKSEVEAALLEKVDKADGYSLVADSEIERLSNVQNYDDSKIKSDILNLSINKLNVDKAYSIDQINSLIGDKVTKEELDAALITKVSNAEGKGLSSNDYTNAEKNKLATIEEGAEKNLVRSVNGLTGDVILQLGNNTSSSVSSGSAYPNFCINSGSVNEYGEPNFITYSEDVITAKAPFIYTTSDGTTHEVKSDINLSTLNYADGRYNLYVTKSSTFELLLLDNEIHYAKVPPTDINANDIWVDVSVYPKKAYIYTGITYKYCEYVPIGSIDVGVEIDEAEPIEPVQPELETTFQIRLTDRGLGNSYSQKYYNSVSLKLRVVKDGVITYVDEVFNASRRNITYDVGTKVSIEGINSCSTIEGYNLENADIYLGLVPNCSEKYSFGRELRKTTVLYLSVTPKEVEELPAENSIKITFANATNSIDNFKKLQLDISYTFPLSYGTNTVRQWIYSDSPYVLNGTSIEMFLGSIKAFETVSGYTQDTHSIMLFKDAAATEYFDDFITESTTVYVKIYSLNLDDDYIEEEEPSIEYEPEEPPSI